MKKLSSVNALTLSEKDKDDKHPHIQCESFTKSMLCFPSSNYHCGKHLTYDAKNSDKSYNAPSKTHQPSCPKHVSDFKRIYEPQVAT